MTTPFPDSLVFKGLKKDSLGANFIGIKVGDVNLSTNVQLRADETMEIMIANRAFEYGEKLVVEVRAKDLQKFAGYQFDLGFDRETLEFVGIEAGEVSGIDRNAFNLNSVAEGRLPTLWYQTGAELRGVSNPVLFNIDTELPIHRSSTASSKTFEALSPRVGFKCATQPVISCHGTH